MNQFLKRLVGFSLGPIMSAVISLGQLVVLGRFLPVIEYGIAGVFQDYLIQLPNFLYLGLDQAYTREYGEAKDKKRLMQQAVILPLVVGLILCGIFLIFSRPLAGYLMQGRTQYAYIIWFGCVWIISTIFERFLLLTIRMEERALEFSGYTLLLKINVFIVSIMLLLLGYRDFRVMVYGLIVGQLLGDVALYVRYRSFMNFSRFTLDPQLIHMMLKFGFPIMIAAGLTLILSYVDNIFLTNTASISETDAGIYKYARMIINMLGVIRSSFASFWVPTAYRWYEEKKSLKHYQFIGDAVLFAMTLMFYGLLIFKPILIVLGGEKYYNIQFIIGFLCFQHVMYTVSEVTTLGIVFSRKTYFNIIVSLLTTLTAYGLNFILAPQLGYLGIAMTSAATYIVFYGARTYFSKQSGFYFSQKKTLISVMMMVGAAYFNSFESPYTLFVTFALMLLTLVCQASTIRKALEIKRNPNEWDFS